MENRSEIFDYLVEHGVRPSAQRLAVMEYLNKNRTHPSADEILSGIKRSMPTISRMTIYNTLNTLTNAGAIIAIDIDPKNRHFDGDTSLHGHFMCNECGKIFDIELERPEEIIRIAPKGFRVTDTQLLFKGVCKDCDRENN